MSCRLEKLDAERQRRLFESAAAEFAAHGFDGASLNRILEKSGMSKSSLYYYFDDKADLFTTLIERSMAVLFREIGGFDPEALTAETFWSTFEELYRRAIAVINKNGWLVQFGGMFYRLRGDPGKGSATGRIFQAARNWVTIIIERGQALGEVRTDLPQTLLIELDDVASGVARPLGCRALGRACGRRERGNATNAHRAVPQPALSRSGAGCLRRSALSALVAQVASAAASLSRQCSALKARLFPGSSRGSNLARP